MERPPRRSLGLSLVLLAPARLVVNSAQRFVYPFLPEIARGLGISLDQAGLLVSARWLAGLSAPVTVSIIGRGRRRRRLAVAGLTIFALGAAITAATNVFIGALAGFVLMGVAKPAYDVAAQAYIADRSDYKRRARAMGVIELTWAGGLLLGAPAAGWLIDRFDWTTPFWVVAALATGALLATRWVLEPDPEGVEAQRARLRVDRHAVAFLAVAALISLGGEMIFVVFGAWLENEFGLSLLDLGWIAALIGVSEMVGEGATLAFADRIGLRRSVGLGLIVSIVALTLLAFFPGVLAVALALVALGLGGFEFTIVSALPLASELKREARARFLSWMVVAFAIGRTIGAAVGPPVFGEFGLPGNAVVAVAANVAALVVLVGWVREPDKEPSA